MHTCPTTSHECGLKKTSLRKFTDFDSHDNVKSNYPTELAHLSRTTIVSSTISLLAASSERQAARLLIEKLQSSFCRSFSGSRGSWRSLPLPSFLNNTGEKDTTTQPLQLDGNSSKDSKIEGLQNANELDFFCLKRRPQRSCFPPSPFHLPTIRAQPVQVMMTTMTMMKSLALSVLSSQARAFNTQHFLHQLLHRQTSTLSPS